MQASITFWLLWVLTALLLAWPLYLSWREPKRMLELPFMVSIFGSYFYVYMAYQATVHLMAEVQAWTLDIGQLVVVLSLAAIFAGWYYALRKETGRAPAAPHGTAGQERMAFRVGQTLCWIGVSMHAVWQSSGVGFETSAYYYMVSYCTYPGVGLCVMALLRDRAARSLLKWTFTFLPAIYMLAPQFMSARRGPTLAWGVLFLGAVALSGRVRIRFWMGAGSLLCLGIITLTFVPARSFLVENATFLQALEQTSVADAVAHKTKDVSDNEFVYHCAVVGTAYETGMYQYGTQLLMLFVHWVPREYWPTKPERGAGLYPSLKEQMPAITGIDMGPGMSAAGLAFPFEDFGFFCVVFWFVFAALATRVYHRARDSDSLLWKGAWLNIIACSHWLIAQDFGAFFVPMMLTQAAMLAVWLGFSRILGMGGAALPTSLAARRSRSQRIGFVGPKKAPQHD
jgi:hypothetical protein